MKNRYFPFFTDNADKALLVSPRINTASGFTSSKTLSTAIIIFPIDSDVVLKMYLGYTLVFLILADKKNFVQLLVKILISILIYDQNTVSNFLK